MSLEIKVQYAEIFECIRVTIRWKTISSYTTSALSTFPSLISIHCRIVQCLPPSVTHWPSLLPHMSFSTCSFVHPSTLSYSYLPICTLLDKSTLSFFFQKVIYQPFSLLALSKEPCCCPSDLPYHMPTEITSMCPDHIMLIFLRLYLSILNIQFQVVTMVPTLHSSGIWRHVVWQTAALLEIHYMYSFDTAFYSQNKSFINILHMFWTCYRTYSSLFIGTLTLLSSPVIVLIRKSFIVECTL